MINTRNGKRQYTKAQPMQIGERLHQHLIEQGWDGNAYMLTNEKGKLAMAYKAVGSDVYDVVKEF